MPNNNVPNVFRRGSLITSALSAALVLASAGCAKTPGNIAGSSGTQLIITMTVAGHINPNYYYFVVFNPEAQTGESVGPLPVLGIPWGNGNGFATGAFTAFMEYTQTGGYTMWQVAQNTTPSLVDFSPLPVPTQSTPVNSNSSQLQFQIPLSEIPTNGITAPYLQMNFITTDRLPGSTDEGTKHYDALGDGTNSSTVDDPQTFPTTVSQLFSNQTANIEPQGDVMLVGTGVSTNDEVQDLDITNWSVEVRAQ